MNIIELLNEDEKKQLIVKSYRKNQIIFEENQQCDYVGFVLDGNVKIMSYSSRGNEILYSSIDKDGMFGNNLIFSINPFYKGHVICNIDCKIAFLNKQQLIKIMQNNQLFLQAYLQYDADLFKDLNNKLKILSLNSALERLYYYLLINKGKIKIESIASLALKLSITRECLSRLIHKLEKEKIIIFKNNEIILN